MKDKDRETARHEAGHAVICVYLRRAILSIEITPNDDDDETRDDGCCKITFINMNLFAPLYWWMMEREAMISLAGPVAELGVKKAKYCYSQKHEVGQDFQDITGIAYELNSGDDDHINEFIEGLWQKVSDILSTPLAQRQIEAVAEALFIKRRLSGRVIRQIIKAVRITPEVGPSGLVGASKPMFRVQTGPELGENKRVDFSAPLVIAARNVP
jgi:hypothetical protein